MTERLTRIDVVVLAVAAQGGAQRAIDTEDVALKAHGLAPSLFAWRKYPEQINLELVRVALSDAKKANNGALLIGSGREGWRLSAQGMEWLDRYGRSKSELLADPRIGEDRTAGSVDTVRKQRELDRLKTLEAWQKWRSGTALTAQDAREVFRIDDYATKTMIESKVVRMLHIVESHDEPKAFIEAAREALK